MYTHRVSARGPAASQFDGGVEDGSEVSGVRYHLPVLLQHQPAVPPLPLGYPVQPVLRPLGAPPAPFWLRRVTLAVQVLAAAPELAGHLPDPPALLARNNVEGRVVLPALPRCPGRLHPDLDRVLLPWPAGDDVVNRQPDG